MMVSTSATVRGRRKVRRRRTVPLTVAFVALIFAFVWSHTTLLRWSSTSNDYLHLMPRGKEISSISSSSSSTIGGEVLQSFLDNPIRIQSRGTLQNISAKATTTTIASEKHGINNNTNPSLSSSFPSFRSPVCYPHYGTTTRTISRIYFFHMRKAGGSTIHMYLRKVAQKWNLTLEVAEGTVLEFLSSSTSSFVSIDKSTTGTHTTQNDTSTTTPITTGSSNNIPPMSPLRLDTLYVTHLREPIARLISHFQYEARWPCDQLVDNATIFRPTMENARNFSDWIHNDPPCQQIERGAYGKVLWQCTRNCYLQWLNYGRPNRNCNARDPYSDGKQIFQERYRMAFQSLAQFHVIIDVGRLFRSSNSRDNEDSVSYGRQLEHFFGRRGLVGLHSQMYCGKESAAANRKYPLMLSEKKKLQHSQRTGNSNVSISSNNNNGDDDDHTANKATTSSMIMNQLRDYNQADIKLYNSFVQCPNDGTVEFPSSNRTRLKYLITTIQT